jgi:GTP-binding protein HflX
MRQTIIDFFDGQLSEGELVIPYGKQSVINEIHLTARVVEETWDDDGARMRIRAEPATLARLQAMLSR